MRIVDGVHGETSSWVFDTDAEYSVARTTREGPASENESAQSVHESDARRRPFGAAISWLVAHLIEGFAAYGEAIYPSFVDHGGFADGHKPNQDSELRTPAEIGHRSTAPWLNASHSRVAENPWQSAKSRTISPSWSATIASRVLEFWSRARRAGEIRLTITRLEALDDHTLKDIGIHRSQIESVARHRDPYDW
jgi:uncharacterized protein YjiS (DUF1127 family)